MVDTPVPNTVNEPTFLGYSQGSQKSSTSSSALGLLSDTIKGGVDVIDNTIKAQASEDVRTKVQSVQDQTISNYMLAGNPPADVPAGVTSELDRAAKLQQANRAGIIRDSYYNLQLDQIARELRYKYSGYKDFIDQRIETMTGVRPASALIKSLRQDVIDTMPQEDKRTETVRSELIKQGVDIAAMENKRGGPIPRPEMESMLANEYKVKVGLETTKAIMTVKDGVAKDNKQVFMQNLNETLGQDFNASIKNNFVSRGVSFDNMVAMATKFQNDPNSFTAPMQEELRTNIGAARLEYERRLMYRLHDNSSGQSIVAAGKMDLKDIEDTKKMWMDRFDSFFNPLLNKDWGAFTANARILETSLSSITAKAINDEHVAAFAAMQKLYGPQVAGQILTLPGGPNVSNLNSAMNTTVKELNVMNIVGQRGMSLAAADSASRSKNNPNVDYGKASQDTVDTLVNMVLSNKTDPVMRSKAAAGLFAPDNVGWLGRIQVKDSNGNVDPAATKAKQLELFQKLTTQDVTNQVVSIGSREPRILNSYVDFALNTGLTINKGTIDSLKSGFVDRTRYAKVTFNPQSGEFEASANNPTGSAAYNAAPASTTQRIGDMQEATLIARDMNIVTRQLMPIIKLQTNDQATGIRSLYSRAGLNIDSLSPASGDKLGGRLKSNLGGNTVADFAGPLAALNAVGGPSTQTNLQGTSTAVPPVNQFDGMRQQLLETMDLYKKNPNPDLQNELNGLLDQMSQYFNQQIPAASIQEVMQVARDKQKK